MIDRWMGADHFLQQTGGPSLKFCTCLTHRVDLATVARTLFYPTALSSKLQEFAGSNTICRWPNSAARPLSLLYSRPETDQLDIRPLREP